MCTNGNQLVAWCDHCGKAVKERVMFGENNFQDIWTLSVGPVEKARNMNLKNETCCCCAGHPQQLGGFAEKSHLDYLLAA
ncbi:MAG: hypothetical protein US57_C0008G0003 [Candidatus Moranbacteria bacterium GW2011_GWC2_37_73]|nr:MAG: hypothetical protein UR95_C0001G0108 [Parcubacteria group bacterium GW2011_GWC1_36_108]KKQ39819.1 MAG: hypothetical protein US57_C0008G0003 [Candidatus Moranbacteria bacterium GW2011_GWC2_37_73]HAS00033.1 hypothetical protein [Candidatus Moranbacteria bacterium]HBI50579.1 hypothetical protein [Candidatus Moranbacteria bacterium]HBU11104.1 hypothetical protein [Candidatus Moranbacteria bacterium]